MIRITLMGAADEDSAFVPICPVDDVDERGERPDMILDWIGSCLERIKAEHDGEKFAVLIEFDPEPEREQHGTSYHVRPDPETEDS